MEPTRRTATVHGHELSFLDGGSGPVVLFIHGILGSQGQWAHLVDRLHDEHRVIVPDLFGHGDSAKPVGDYSLGAHAATMRDLLDRLDIDRVTLVGHSLGGGIAMEFYYLFPERVDRLVLVASGGLGREVNAVLRSATLPGAELGPARDRVRVGADACRGRRPGAVPGGLAARLGPHARSGRASRRWGTARAGGPSWPRPAPSSTPAVRVSVRTTTCADALPIPTLIVWGTRDRMIPAWHAITAQRSMPRVPRRAVRGGRPLPAPG